jgi:hypothetical protein
MSATWSDRPAPAPSTTRLLRTWARAVRRLDAARGALADLERAAAEVPADHYPSRGCGCTAGELTTLAGRLAWQASEARGCLAEPAPLPVDELASPVEESYPSAHIIRRAAQQELAAARAFPAEQEETDLLPDWIDPRD